MVEVRRESAEVDIELVEVGRDSVKSGRESETVEVSRVSSFSPFLNGITCFRSKMSVK